MSVKEIESYAVNSNLVVNSVNTLNLTTQNETTTNAITANTVNATNGNIGTLTVTSNSSMAYLSAYQLSLTNSFPSIYETRIATTITAPVTTLTKSMINNGIILGSGSAIFRTSFDLAVNLYNNEIANQIRSVLCINNTAFQWNFDTLDPSHVFFNGNIVTPIIPAGTQKMMFLELVSTTPITYNVWM